MDESPRHSLLFQYMICRALTMNRSWTQSETKQSKVPCLFAVSERECILPTAKCESCVPMKARSVMSLLEIGCSAQSRRLRYVSCSLRVPFENLDVNF